MTRSLTPAEHKILVAASYGETAAETAARLGVKLDTVRTHRKRVVSKLDARNMTNAVAVAYEDGILGAARGAAAA